MSELNRQWRLIARPVGLPKPTDFELVSVPIERPGPDEVLVKIVYVSLAPGLRVYMSAAKGLEDKYAAKTGAPIRAWAIGRVVESRSDRFPVGTYVRDRPGNAGIQDYSVLPATTLEVCDPSVVALPAYLGVLGTQGLTAHIGMLHIGSLKAHETVVVSGAAGGVGSIAGQIGKIKNARVIGIAGGSDKCRYVTNELGFDACLDYKAGDLDAALTDMCPQGIDLFFDNVGGETLDTCLSHMAINGRIAICGATAAYNSAAPLPLKNHIQILNRQLRVQGFSYYANADKFDEAKTDLQAWVRSGRLKHFEDVVVGLENFYPTFMKLFSGQTVGKLVLQISDEVA